MEAAQPEVLIGGFAVFCRAGALLFMIPFLGNPVPVTVRVALALMLSYFAVLVAGDVALPVPAHWWELVVLGVRESFTGFVLGMAVQVIFFLCQVAGRMISMEIGLMQGNMFNPMLREQETIMGTGLTVFAFVVVFMTETHHWILQGFFQSLELAPVGSSLMDHASLPMVVRETAGIFRISLQMSAPLIAVNYIVLFAFAILGRAVPTVNVFLISFPVRIILGFFVLGLVFVLLAEFLLGVIQGTPERMMQFLPFR